jgi:hypothetical protein
MHSRAKGAARDGTVVQVHKHGTAVGYSIAGARGRFLQPVADEVIVAA